MRTIPRTTDDGLRRLAVAFLAVSLAVSACGTQGADGNDPGGAGSTAGPPGGDGGSTGNGGGTTNGSGGGGPITARMDSGTYGYTTGRCEIIDDVVYLEAVDEAGTGGIEVTLPEWDREIAYARRDGRVSMSRSGSDTGDTFELVAGRGESGTTWDWIVSGQGVTVTARMGNRSTATRDGGVEQFTEYRDVTIDIQCSGGVFGSGPFADLYADRELSIIEDPMQRVPGRVSVEVEGETYEIAYLTTCQFFQDQVSAEGIANEANVWLYSEGAGVLLDFAIGDVRDEFTDVVVERWSLPPDAQQMDDFRFEGSDTVRTWSGTVVSEGGTSAEATITVECTEGDSFDSAGSASVILDGTTYDLDVVVSCSIDGTAIDFFGRSSSSDVAIVVTGGGSQILLADETGQQNATRDVAFDVAGQQATWTGVLAGDRQATVAISCG